MASTWVPAWAGVAWLAVYAVIAGGHLSHLARAGGGERAWHATHVLMAAGMIDMFWPGGSMPVGSAAGQAVFAAAAAVAAAGIAVAAARRRPAGRLWVLSAADLAVMYYMFALSSVRYLIAFTVLLAAWQAAEALAWASGYLSPAPAAVLAAGGGGGAVAARRPGSGGHSGLAVRVGLAVMSLGMGYMLLAMQFGMPNPGPAMPGM